MTPSQRRSAVSARWWAFAVAATLLVAGCSGGEAGPSETTLASGATLTPIYKLQPKAGFDPYVTIDALADQFDLGAPIYDDFLDEPRAFLVAYPKDHDDDRYIEVNLQDQWWHFQSALTREDDKCATCEPVSISHDEALNRAKAIWDESGSLDDQMDFEVTDVELSRGGYVTVRVEAWRTLDGQRIEGTSGFSAEFGNGDELLSIFGSIGWPTEVGTAELIPVGQAYANKLGSASPDIGTDKLDKAEIVWGVEFDRTDSSRWIIPFYRIPISNELESLTTETPAVDRSTLILNDDQPKGS